MSRVWIERWQTGRTGWHEPQGNTGLRAHWPAVRAGTKVLVPLCGASPDMLWLAETGHAVTGVELSDVAVRFFFEESGLAYTLDNSGPLPAYRARDLEVTISQRDYFEYPGSGFDALYDRGALVALPADLRPAYIEKTRQCVGSDAGCLIVTLEYDQDLVEGPPFAVMPEELGNYWPDLQRVEARDDLETSPPKFRDAGLDDLREVFWLRPSKR